MEASQLITSIGKQLATSKTCPAKDSLVKLLKQVTNTFPELQQSESLKSAIKPLSDSLIRLGLLHHKDKDVRLLVGICLCEIIRVLAPNPGFSDTVFRDIFILILSLFGELDDSTSPYFSRRVKLLDTVAKLQFCVLMLDTGCEDLVLKMFKSFFNVVREDHPQTLINSMSSIIACILKEKVKEVVSGSLNFEADISQTLIDVILQHIIMERKGVSSASFRLAVSVLKNCCDKVDRYICQFLTSCILNRDAVGSVVKEFYHEIIFQIFQIAPEMLLPVIPNLTHELLTDQVDVRIKALHLIRKLVSLPGNHVVKDYHFIFIELLNRFTDKSVEVRLAALSCAKSLCLTNPTGRESIEVLSAVQGRLLDQDVQVRTESVKVICDLGKTNLNFVSSDLISGVSERLRDKKVSVRNAAFKKLVELYQDYCTRCTTGFTFLEHIEQIPCKFLMLCYEKDCQEFRPQSIELVLQDLFPACLSIEERTKHWIFMFSLFKPPHLKALKTILSQKRRLQDWMQNYLDLWSRQEGNGSGDAERKMKALVLKMSACFCSPTQAKDCFQKLNELNDERIITGLQKILSNDDSQTTMDGYLKEIGNQNLLSEFFSLLSMKVSFTIFSSRHVHYILDCLSSDECEKKLLKDYYVQLLMTIIGAFPTLLQGSEKQFQSMLREGVIPFNEQLIEILAREGQQMSIKLGDLSSSLVKACLEGTRVQSKLAVSAIAALVDTSEQDVLSELCKILVESLHNGQNIPTILQSLGCVAQHFVSAFEAHDKSMTQYIVEEIFQQNDVSSTTNHYLVDETTESCRSCKLKVFGLKTLVRSFLPHKHTIIYRPINFLLDIIHQMLQNVFSDGNRSCEALTLAAAKSVLRLSRKWELHVSPHIFRLTISTAKDQSPCVRRSFVAKVHKLLRNHTLPSRYACAFSFAASDSLQDLQCDALKYLEEYIREYSKGAQIHETIAMQGAVNNPLYLTVFLVHILAHDTNFPAPDCQDEDKYAQFLRPLFITLKALVNVNIVNSSLCGSSNVFSFLQSVLQAIKMAEDAVDCWMTQKLHLLAEIGISILNSLNTNESPLPRARGLVLLPSSLYRSGHVNICEDNIYSLNGYKADEHFIKKLVSSFEIGSTSLHHGQVNTNSSQKSYGNYNAISGNSDLLTNKTKNQFDGTYTRKEEMFDTSCQDVDAGPKNNLIMHSPHRFVGLHKSLLSQKETSTKSQDKEDTLTRSIVCANQSKLCRADEHMDCSSSDVINSSREAFVCKHIELCSPSEKCYDSSAVDDFDSTISTLLDLDDLHQPSRDHYVGGSSTNGNQKNVGDFGSELKPEDFPKNKDFCVRKVCQAVERDEGCKDAIGTSTSEVIDTNENVIARRTRRKKA